MIRNISMCLALSAMTSVFFGIPIYVSILIVGFSWLVWQLVSD